MLHPETIWEIVSLSTKYTKITNSVDTNFVGQIIPLHLQKSESYTHRCDTRIYNPENKTQAQKITEILPEEKLIACVNYSSI